MIFPDKLISFQNSILAKSIYILKVLNTHKLSASDLFIEVKDHFEDISEFIVALDVLFALNRLKYNEELQVMEYARTNKL